jgi:maleylpyruvate isomerase
MASTSADPDQSDISPRIKALAEATGRLAAAVDQAAAAGDDAFRRPSQLPNWTIGHLVSHLARNADGLGGVLAAAGRGEQVAMYASPQARDADIEAGARRATEAIRDDFHSTAATFAQVIDGTPAPVWSATVDLGRGGPTTAEVVLSARLAEVEMHHHDLGVDAGLALLDDNQAQVLIAALLRSYVRTRDVTGLTLVPDGGTPIDLGDGGPVVAGSAVDLIGWLSGRTDGSTLRLPAGLPELPAW